MGERFEFTTEGVRLGGWVRGDGEPVLLLHGGPGLGFDYLDPVADELAGFRVASYQQRGLPPSQTDGPFAIADHVADCRRVLDGLGWERAVVVGHSWGGHLALHVGAALPDRVRALLAVDPLGGAGDGGSAAFEAELAARIPPEDLARAEELDERAMRGEGTAAEALESLRLVWPAYFPSPQQAPPMPDIAITVDGYAETWESVLHELPALEAALSGIGVPVGFVVGGRSPMPAAASTDTADRIPGAWVEVVDGAGHFVWLDRPGAVRASLERLLGS